MISIRGAGYSHLLSHGDHVRCLKLRDVNSSAEPPSCFLQDQPDHGIGSTQGSETAKTEPMALVFYMNRGYADLTSKAWQRDEWSFLVAIAMPEKPLHFASGFDAQYFRIRCIQGGAVFSVLIEKQHGSTFLLARHHIWLRAAGRKFRRLVA